MLGAELSTGLETWSIIIRGILPKNNTWNNIAVRWKQPVTDQTAFDTFKDNNQMDMIGGLEIFLNLEKVKYLQIRFYFNRTYTWSSSVLFLLNIYINI